MSLGLADVHHQTFGPDKNNPMVPELLDFWAERLHAYRVPVVAGRHFAGNRNSFAAMSLHLADHYRADGELDLVITAHTTPDCDPYVSLAGVFANRYPGTALVFAISDQGRVAPFSALRIARGNHAGRRALVIALDQGAVPYRDAGLADLSVTSDHAVGLLLSADGTTRLSALRQVTDVPPEHAGAAVAAEVAMLEPDVVISGAHVEPPRGFAVRPAPRDQLCTAVWSALADEMAVPLTRPRRVVVVEYEPELHYLGLIALDVPAARPRGHRHPARATAGST